MQRHRFLAAAITATVLLTFTRSSVLALEPLGGPFRVDAADASRVAPPVVRMAADGRIAILWAAANSTPPYSLRLRLFDATGASQAPEILVSADIGWQGDDYDMTFAGDGDLVVVWTSNGRNHIRSFDAAGSPRGPADLVPESGTQWVEYAYSPAVTSSDRGGVELAWVEKFFGPIPSSTTSSSMPAAEADAPQDVGRAEAGTEPGRTRPRSVNPEGTQVVSLRRPSGSPWIVEWDEGEWDGWDEFDDVRLSPRHRDGWFAAWTRDEDEPIQLSSYGESIESVGLAGYHNHSPSLASDLFGNGVVAWTAEKKECPSCPAESAGAIFQRFDAELLVHDVESPAETDDNRTHEQARVAMSWSGDITLAWVGRAASPVGEASGAPPQSDDSDIFVRTFDCTGQPTMDAEVQANEDGSAIHSAAAVATAAGEQVAVAWVRDGSALWARRYVRTDLCRLCGDAGGDRRISATDALAVLRSAVEITAAGACPPEACDAGGDGAVTAEDALRVLRWVVGHALAMSCPRYGLHPMPE